MTEPVYFRCDTTIFVRLESQQELDAFQVGDYIGRKVAKMVQDTNSQHKKLPSGKMVLEAGDMTTSMKDKKPRGRFKE